MADQGGRTDAEVTSLDTETAPADVDKMNKRHIRGSMLLLVGRLVSLLFTVVTQIVIVRALSKAEYGVFAYAFTLAASGRILLSLGQGKLLSRFMSKYEEQRDYARMFGAMLLAVGTIVLTAMVMLGALAVAARPLLGTAFDDPNAAHVLLLLMFLAPLEALDQVFVSIFAVFSKPTAIFFRKYLADAGAAARRRRGARGDRRVGLHAGRRLRDHQRVRHRDLHDLLAQVLRERGMSAAPAARQCRLPVPRGVLVLVPHADQRARLHGHEHGQRGDPRRATGAPARWPTSARCCRRPGSTRSSTRRSSRCSCR